MFSIIIPIHNKLPHIDRTINSVLNQTFKNFELLLVDDASSDGSKERIETYSDPRIRIFYRKSPGHGGYAARNVGIKKSQYEWLTFLDADDTWDRDYLKSVYEAIQKNPNGELFTTDWISKKGSEIIDEGLNLKGFYTPFTLKDYLNNYRYVWTGVVTVKKALILRDSNNGFPEDNPLCKKGGDIDTWIRWLYKSTQCIHINKTLAHYHRDIEGQVTSDPTLNFCAYSTIKSIYNNTDDSSLKKSLKYYNDRFIYTMLVGQLQAGMPIDFKQVKKMHLNTYSILRVLKLYWLKIKRLY